MNKILILTTRPLHNGPRIIREIDIFKPYFQVVTVGLTEPHCKEVDFYNIRRVHKSIVDRFIRKVYQKLNKGRLPDIKLPIMNKYLNQLVDTLKPNYIITHEPDFLPYLSSMKYKFGFKIVYNAHEYHPLQFDSSQHWLNTVGYYYDQLYGKHLKYVDLFINVCQGIADKCLTVYGKKSIVIPNACRYYSNLEPNFLSNQTNRIRIIHHGIAIREREIEIMIRAIGSLNEKYELDLILVPGDRNYIAELIQLVSSYKNVKIVPAVDYNEIVPFLNQYDIGLFNLPPKTFNYRNALPNKFFEFIQARLCVVISNSVEMARFVNKYNLGKISEGFSEEQLKSVLETLSIDEINQYKSNSHATANNVSAEQYNQIYFDALKRLN